MYPHGRVVWLVSTSGVDKAEALGVPFRRIVWKLEEESKSGLPQLWVVLNCETSSVGAEDRVAASHMHGDSTTRIAGCQRDVIVRPGVGLVVWAFPPSNLACSTTWRKVYIIFSAICNVHGVSTDGVWRPASSA